jgi:hypothetical protein
MITQHVITCNTTHEVLRNNAIRASRNVNTGTLGRSSSVCPMRCPVALAQIRTSEFKKTDPRSIHDDLHDMPCCFVSHALLHDSTIVVLPHPDPNNQEYRHH